MSDAYSRFIVRVYVRLAMGSGGRLYCAAAALSHLRHAVLFPTAVAMAFELAVYGGLAGLLYHLLPRKKWTVYVVLVLSMIGGRIVWGIVQLILAGLSGKSFTWALFIAGAVTNAIPGIILHLVLIPVLVILMDKAGLSLNKPQTGKEQEHDRRSV